MSWEPIISVRRHLQGAQRALAGRGSRALGHARRRARSPSRNRSVSRAGARHATPPGFPVQGAQGDEVRAKNHHQGPTGRRAVHVGRLRLAGGGQARRRARAPSRNRSVSPACGRQTTPLGFPVRPGPGDELGAKDQHQTPSTSRAVHVGRQSARMRACRQGGARACA